MEGQSEDCPFLRVQHRSQTEAMPQWRGSRKTARFSCPFRREFTIRSAAMEGQSEDCPFPASLGLGYIENTAAMEGQTEDCPFPEVGCGG